VSTPLLITKSSKFLATATFTDEVLSSGIGSDLMYGSKLPSWKSFTNFSKFSTLQTKSNMWYYF